MTGGESSGIVREGTRLRLVSRSGLLIEASTSGSDGLLDTFYKDYDAAFVLANEKEGFDGFVACLDLNSGQPYARLAARYGGFREFIVVASDPATGERIGGANFIAFPLSLSGAPDAVVLSQNLNYVFVNPEARRHGHFKRLVGDLPNLSLRLLAATNAHDVPASWLGIGREGGPGLPPTYTFIEQNDPYRMSREDYETDTRFTGLDQLARIGIWARLGARIVDFPYVQPPLSADQAADEGLVYAVLGAQGESIDAGLLREHLERFFGISVLKGRDPAGEPAAARQLAELDRLHAAARSIPLLTSPAAAGRGCLPAPALQAGHATSLRDAIRASTQA